MFVVIYGFHLRYWRIIILLLYHIAVGSQDSELVLSYETKRDIS